MNLIDRRSFLGRLAGGTAGALGLFWMPTSRLAGISPPEPGPGADLAPRTVGLRSLGGRFVFDPPGLAIAPGETVTWLNMGDFHTVTSFHPDLAHLVGGELPLRMPREAEPFHSGFLGLDAGSVFERSFPVEGVYDYFCQPHYNFGMVARLIVGEPAAGPATTRPLSELPEAARRELPAVEDIQGPRGRSYEWASRVNGILLLRTRDGAAGAAAEAVLASASGDETLGQALGGSGRERLRERLEALAGGVREGAPYEELVRRADAAKDVLRSPGGSN
ncbi:MAG: plastocyanin/azurin family copper-binding protein [Gemmatimonadota bacterium]|nr:plastocyanin/azurin family copper-binding protein [Gemmatimonadota bacterium]